MNKNIFLLAISFVMLFNISLFSQQAGKIYLAASSTGRLYDITTGTTPIPVNLPAYYNNNNGAALTNLAIGYDTTVAGNPLVFINGDNGAVASTATTKFDILKNGVDTGVDLPMAVGGYGVNNVLGPYFGQLYGFGTGTKNLYRLYPTVSAPMVITGDAIFNATTSSIFLHDTVFDYQNNIYTIVTNTTTATPAVTTRYLYRITITGATTATATQIAPITGPVSTAAFALGSAYLNGKLYFVDNANPQNIYTVDMVTGVSVLDRQLDSSFNFVGSKDLASVDYFLPFTFTCGAITFQGTNNYVAGTPSTRILNIPITSIYQPGTYTINVNGSGFINPAYQVTIASNTTSINVPVTYAGTSGGTIPLTIDLNGSTTTCTVNAIVADDSDGDGISNSQEGLCSTGGFEGFDDPLRSAVNDNNILTGVTNYNGWQMINLESTQPSPFNIVRVNGAGYTSGPVYANTGNQYLDINGTGGTLYRDFTLTTPTVLSTSAFFSGRELTGATVFNTSIQVARMNGTTPTVLFSGNAVNFTSSSPTKDTWLSSSLNNIVLPAGTYRIQMYIHNNGHVDSIAYCFATDTDGDGIPDYQDLDSDNDGIFDSNECGSSDRISNGTFPTTGGNTETVPGWTVGGTYAASGAWASPTGRVALNADGLYFTRDNGTTSTLQQALTGVMPSTTISLNNLYWFRTDNDATSGTEDPNAFTFTVSYAGVTYLTINSTTGTTPTVTASNGAIINLTNLPSVYSRLAPSSKVNLEIKLPNGIVSSGSLLLTFNAGTSSTRVRDLSIRSISLLSCKDTDGDGTPDTRDTDSDNDGCPDVIEGGATFTTGATYITNNMLNTAINTSGVPALPTATPAIVGYTQSAGQTIGNSQNNALNDCKCYKAPNITTGSNEETKHGISAFNRAASGTSSWPGVRNNGWTALESNTKPFVMNRMPSSSTTNLGEPLTTVNGTAVITSPIIGMTYYDTRSDCMRVNIDGTRTGWRCFNTQSCPDEN